MIKCPRCEHPVDEKVRDTCPICNAPIVSAGGSQSENQSQSQFPSGAGAPAPAVGGQVTAPPGAAPIPPAYNPLAPSSPPSFNPLAPSQPTAPASAAPLLNQPPAQSNPAQPPFNPLAPGAPPTASASGAAPLLNQPSQGTVPAFNPLAPGVPQAAPQPLSSAMGGGQGAGGWMAPPGSSNVPRASLSGEIIPPVARPAAPPGSSYGAGAARPGAGGVSPASRRSSDRLDLAAPMRSSANPVGVFAFVAVILLLLVGGGGYWFLHRTNPKDQMNRFVTALKAQDWQTMYTLIDDKTGKYKDADDFASQTKSQIDSNPLARTVMGMISNADIKVGEPTMNDGTATVPLTVTIMGATIPAANIHLTDHYGLWKIDSGSAAGQAIPVVGSKLSGLGR
ncbi:MAG TPA: hypothetical protein VGS41_13075 [Chthonomonadales bacterium]|nr:hypothetical protein [Chthonomonadales bacterium]